MIAVRRGPVREAAISGPATTRLMRTTSVTASTAAIAVSTRNATTSTPSTLRRAACCLAPGEAPMPRATLAPTWRNGNRGRAHVHAPFSVAASPPGGRARRYVAPGSGGLVEEGVDARHLAGQLLAHVREGDLDVLGRDLHLGVEDPARDVLDELRARVAPLAEGPQALVQRPVRRGELLGQDDRVLERHRRALGRVRRARVRGVATQHDAALEPRHGQHALAEWAVDDVVGVLQVVAD